MQIMQYLHDWFDKHVNRQHFLFSMTDMRALFPGHSAGAYKGIIHRAVRKGYLIRICHSLYTFKDKVPRDGLTLFHIARHLRSQEFNYLSLETVLSEAGVISQIPLSRIFVMSSGRSSIVDCGKYGSIEFVHTVRTPLDVMDQIFYDKQYKMWRAMVPLALQDMKRTKRNMDLIDWDEVDEYL
jgi:hypothetical protein